jgi:hypothetical protein
MVKRSLNAGNKPGPGGYVLDTRCFPMNAAFVPMIFAFSVVAQIAAAQTGNAPFCLQTAGGAKCAYMTMAECERARGNSSASQCITQADAKGATGLGEPVGPPPIPTVPQP